VVTLEELESSWTLEDLNKTLAILAIENEVEYIYNEPKE
jgi:hypothetical protein